MRKKIICLVISLFALVFVLGGCSSGADRNYEKEPLTVEEIRAETQKRFFDVNGKLRESGYEGGHFVGGSYWANGLANSSKYEPSAYEAMQGYMDDIVGFDVQLIKSIWGCYSYFLVEFEPYGFFCGCLTENYLVSYFHPFPSPFKLSNIADEDRYFLYYRFMGRSYKFLTPTAEGEYVDIWEYATMGAIFKIPYNWSLTWQYYDSAGNKI